MLYCDKYNILTDLQNEYSTLILVQEYLKLCNQFEGYVEINVR